MPVHRKEPLVIGTQDIGVGVLTGSGILHEGFPGGSAFEMSKTVRQPFQRVPAEILRTGEVQQIIQGTFQVSLQLLEELGIATVCCVDLAKVGCNFRRFPNKFERLFCGELYDLVYSEEKTSRLKKQVRRSIFEV